MNADSTFREKNIFHFLPFDIFVIKIKNKTLKAKLIKALSSSRFIEM